MNNRNRVLTMVLSVLVAGMTAGYVLALNPTFQTIIQPGSQNQPFTFTIFGDGLNYFARNGMTGAIDYSNTNFSLLWSSIISGLSGGQYTNGPGSIFIKKLPPSLESYYIVPISGSHIAIDYIITSTLYVPMDVSVYSDGASLLVTTLNEAVFYLNPTGYTYQARSAGMHLENIYVVGSTSKTNTTGIYNFRYNRGSVIDRFKTLNVAFPVIIEGEVYDGIIENSIFSNSGVIFGTGITLKKGSGSVGPNAFRIQNNDIESFSVGIDGSSATSSTFDMSVKNNWLESNTIGIKGIDHITENFIQPGSSNTGIIQINNNNRIENNNFLLNTNAIGVSVTSDSTMLFSGNYVSIVSNGAKGILANAAISQLVLSNNKFDIAGGITGTAITTSVPDVPYFQEATISTNLFQGGNPSIYCNCSAVTISNNVFYAATKAIRLNGATNVLIGNIFNSGTTDIEQISGSTNNRIIGNVLSGTNKILLTGGTTPVIHSNNGYISENTGSITLSGNTTYIITHGINIAPTIFYFTPNTTTCGSLAVSSITTSRMTVTAASSCTASIYWYASISP